MRPIDRNRVEALKEYLKAFRTDNDRFPTFREIFEGRGYKSRQTLQVDISRLKEEGFLTATENGHLSFTDTAGDFKGTAIAVVGSVRCGAPEEAVEEVEGCVIFPTSIFGSDKNLVLLKAKGDSMKNKQISDGDLLIVRKQPSADIGEIVIALLETGDTTCKILRKDSAGKCYLEAANPDYQDIYPEGAWCIYGIVQHVIHSFT